jgi:hypothetical protein
LQSFLLLVEITSSLLREKRYSPVLDSSDSFSQTPIAAISKEEDSRLVSPPLCGAVFDAFGRLFCFSSFSSASRKRFTLPKSYFDYKIFSLKMQMLESSDEKPSFVDRRSKDEEQETGNLIFSFRKSTLMQQELNLNSADSFKSVLQTSVMSANFPDLCGVDNDLSKSYVYNYILRNF